MARILAIDDEPTILSLLATILKKDGHEVVAAENADRAFDLNLSRFDLVICDVMMPGTDGFAFVSAVRDRLDCPIVFLTAKSEENDAVTGLSIGADDYIGSRSAQRSFVRKWPPICDANVASTIRRFHSATYG